MHVELQLPKMVSLRLGCGIIGLSVLFATCICSLLISNCHLFMWQDVLNKRNMALNKYNVSMWLEKKRHDEMFKLSVTLSVHLYLQFYALKYSALYKFFFTDKTYLTSKLPKERV